jgi:hypothetical protein
MKSSFPFASLALLITVIASLLVCVDIERWRVQYAWMTDKPWRALAIIGGAALFGGLIGATFMFFSNLSWRARLLAPIAGILAAEIGVLILVAPGPIWRSIFAVGVLLCTAILFRLGAE